MNSFVFDFPLQESFDERILKGTQENTCVISVIGKSALGPQSNAKLVNCYLQQNIFPINEKKSDSEDLCPISGYYSGRHKTVFLHMQAPTQTEYLVHLLKNLSDEKQENILSWWDSAQYHYARKLLFIFNVSHIILLTSPGSSFDMSYVRLFKALDNCRQKLQSSLTDALRDASAPSQWVLKARLCSPRVLFLFESSPWIKELNETKKTINVTKTQHQLEDVIYRVLRRSRIITNISNNSLFAVPSNTEYVYICSTEEVSIANVGSAAERYMSVLHSYTDDRLKQRSATAVSSFSSFGPQPLCDDLDACDAEMKVESEPRFCTLLQKHIDRALSDGFNDNLGRNPPKAVFNIYTFSEWLRVSNQLYKYFISDDPDQPATKHFEVLRNIINVDMKFSDTRCSKVLSVAEGTYTENLPPAYTKQVHEAQLAKSLSVLQQQGRGPALERYKIKLTQLCNSIWTDGRQLCEETSVTGRHCTNKLHRLDEADDRSSLPVEPHTSGVMFVSSCNCGRTQTNRPDPFTHWEANYEFYKDIEQECCKDLDRIEFEVFVASKKYDPTTKKPKDDKNPPNASDQAAEPERKVSLGTEESSEEPDVQVVPDVSRLRRPSDSSSVDLSYKFSLDSYNSEVSPERADLSQPANLGQTRSEVGQQSGEIDAASDGSNEAKSDQWDEQTSYQGERDSEAEVNVSERDENSGAAVGVDDKGSEDSKDDGDDSEEDQAADNEQRTDKAEEGLSQLQQVTEELETINIDEDAMRRQTSVTEHLSTMVCSSAPEHLLPEFSSWSLVSLGKYMHYNKQNGLEMPGFLSGANYLLHWDVPMKPVDSNKSWPAASRDAGKARIFIGIEYECPRGHRFLCSSPDKMIKVPSSSQVKDTAHKLLTTDMPLYSNCSCRNSSGVPGVGQLMRIHVALPERCPKVVLKPRVRASSLPDSPVFYPTITSTMLTNGKCWVLRLPYVYCDEKGPYLSPHDAEQMQSCLLLKGFLTLAYQS